MEKEFISGRMVINTLVCGGKENEMEMGKSFTRKVEIPMKASGQTICIMDGERTRGRTGTSILGSIKIIKSMGRAD